MKTLCAVFALLALSGCSSLNQAYSAFSASSLISVQGAEDNNIKTWAVDACGTPFSAAIRNPQIVPALEKLCLPAGAQSSPLDLLLGIKPVTAQAVVPAQVIAPAPVVAPVVTATPAIARTPAHTSSAGVPVHKPVHKSMDSVHKPVTLVPLPVHAPAPVTVAVPTIPVPIATPAPTLPNGALP